MRHILPAFFAFAALLSPVFAQDDLVTPEQVEAATTLVEGAELSEDAYLNLWCGAAFSLIATGLTGTDADSVKGMQDVVFQKAAAEMIALEVSEEDFVALAQSFDVIVRSQVSAEGGTADFGQEDCEAAATAG